MKCLLITYFESADEIHFIFIDIKHKDYIDKMRAKVCFPECKIDDIDELTSFIIDNKLASQFVQAYVSEKWPNGFEIVEVVHIPELGC